MSTNRVKLAATSLGTSAALIASYYAHKSRVLTVVGIAATVGIRYYAEEVKRNQTKTDRLINAASALPLHFFDLAMFMRLRRPGILAKFLPVTWTAFRGIELYTTNQGAELCVTAVSCIPICARQHWTK
jgi:uncharacterized membrane protein (UPF0136 family)